MKKFFFVFILMTFLSFNSCIVDLPTDELPVDDNNNLITVRNEGRITLVNKSVVLETDVNVENNRYIMTENETPQFEYNINFSARIEPVSFIMNGDEITVQANDIVISDKRAYIAYNYAKVDADDKDRFAGAIQIVDIQDEDNPTIILEVEFRERQITSLYVDEVNNEIIFGGSVNPDIFEGNRSFVSKFDISNPNEEDMISNIVYLNSFTVTSITKYDNKYFVAVGAKDGGVHQLNLNLEEDGDFIEMDDVRSIDSYSAGAYGLAGTYDSDNETGLIFNLLNSSDQIDIGEYTSFEHKSTIQLFEQPNGFHDEDVMAFLGLAEEGFKMVQIGNNVQANEKIIFERELSDLAPVSPEFKTALNSVSYDGGFAFLALGEFGFKVMRVVGEQIKLDENGDIVWADEDNGIYETTLDNFVEVVGNHRINLDFYQTTNYFSFNHIEYREIIRENQELNYLFAAAGGYGVNIYNLTHNNDYIIIPEDEEIDDKINDILENEEYEAKHFYFNFLKNTELTVTFIKSKHKTEFGYVFYDDENREQIGNRQIVFEAAANKGNGGSIEKGYTSQPINFSPEEKIAFYVNGQANNTWHFSDWKLDQKRAPRNNNFHYSYYADEVYNKIYLFIDPLNQAGKNKYDRFIVVLNFPDESDPIFELLEIIHVDSFDN